ncbi:type II toxin-antitoxin system VapC family toxin [Rhodoplanes sp. TEM]|uniref:Type II toxin-antitoxin system VapC family toxin n=1 Tax=Rhodoplanes tepidamans TaxID=200616 RepID=A0ABT5JL74_RHOTP|nr:MULTISPECIES: type II toxin-antitoxin system VapC family toxin [Rhodoplanes]MDC7789665.1 type II toxin-antitoxin system VapC family toxin [Rhodoplanes tepidamans]MDC7983858.1 type II toxin-antitoxin system VapC family toxin [Rhodoplanes sp. TEM]MDQ0359130.1 PIN domain nuclease of toxin-antitoxin system [Rhodoplanes tepidamans]
MRVLIDTHVVLALLRRSLDRQYPGIASRLVDPGTVGHVSVASLWEIAIKTRLGKLELGMLLDDVAGYLEAVGLTLLPIEARHVITAAEPEPETRDPFDRLLLAQCQVEDLRLATVDRALVDHRLALKA